MSYDIIYNRAFIKVDDKRTIPFLQAGSSNCFEASGKNPKRSRSWENMRFHCGNSIIGNNDAILKHIDQCKADRIERCKQQLEEHKNDSWAYDDKNYGYHISVHFYGKKNVSFNAYKSYFANGIKTAKTIEEYKEMGITFHLSVYCWDKQKEFVEKGIEDKGTKYITSTNELIDSIKEYEDYYLPLNFSVHISANISDYTAKRLKKKRTRGNREIISVKTAWVLKTTHSPHYFTRKTKWGYKYTYQNDFAKKFKTEQQAKTFLDKFKTHKEDFEPTLITGEFNIPK